MDARRALTLKKTLEALRRIGSVGMTKKDILDLAELSAGMLTTEERDALWEELEGRRWIVGHWEPILRVERWSVTERGVAALGGM